MKKGAPSAESSSKLTPDKRKEIDAAYARRDMDFLRQCFASNNAAVSEYSERLVEQLVELDAFGARPQRSFFVQEEAGCFG